MTEQRERFWINRFFVVLTALQAILFGLQGYAWFAAGFGILNVAWVLITIAWNKKDGGGY